MLHQVGTFNVGKEVLNHLYRGLLLFRHPGVHIHRFSKVLSQLLSSWYVGALLGFPIIFVLRLRTNVVGLLPLVIKFNRLTLPSLICARDIVQGKTLFYEGPVHLCGDDSFEENKVLFLS